MKKARTPKNVFKTGAISSEFIGQSIAKHQSNLALVLQELGELHEAKRLLEKALASDEKTYPKGHPILSRRLCNLALVQRDMGDLKAAKDLLEAAIVWRIPYKPVILPNNIQPNLQM